MKIVTIEGGRVLDLVPTEELRPRHGVYLPDLIRSITERYAFSVVPTNIAEGNKSGVKFEHGKITIDGNIAVIKELAVYSDGLIVDSFDTAVADFVLDDLLSWATATFNLQERKSPVHRTYTSAVVIDFEKLIEPALGNLAKVCGLLSESLHRSYGWNYEYNLNRLSFSVDPLAIPHLRATQFFIERRLQVPYSENRYYSLAPLQTEEHLRLLETIERELLA